MRCTHVMVIPWRKKKGQKEICIITSRGRGEWIVPKGWRERRVPDDKLAIQEAWEEAGLVGVVKPAKPCRDEIAVTRGGKKHRYRIYTLKVDHETRSWPETAERKRRWVPIDRLDDYIACKDLRKTIEACAA